MKPNPFITFRESCDKWCAGDLKAAQTHFLVARYEASVLEAFEDMSSASRARLHRLIDQCLSHIYNKAIREI